MFVHEKNNVDLVVPDDKDIIHFAYIIGVDDYYAKTNEEIFLGIINIFTLKEKPSFIRESIIKQKGLKNALVELMEKYKIYSNEYEEIVNEYKLMVKIVNKNLVKELGITYDELGKKCTKLEKECAYRLISLMRK